MIKIKSTVRLKNGIPLFSLSLGAFIFITSEFLPVGLLSEIAKSFSMSESRTGVIMVVYAWSVAILSLPLTAYTSRWNRRSLMLGLMISFVVSHLLIAIAPNFAFLMVARVLVASTHAVFWAVVIPLGVRLVAKGQEAHAISIIATGPTLGSVLGVPIGTFLGQHYGWRFSFGIIAFCSAVIGITLFKALPSMPSENAGDFHSIGKLFRRQSVRLVYLLTVLCMSGHFTVFTFISPYLQQVAQQSVAQVPTALLVFGCSGFLGSILAPLLINHRIKKSAFISLSIITLCLFLFLWASATAASLYLLLFLWGVSFMVFNLILQKLVLRFAFDAADVGMAGFSGIYNVGIGAGALFGSLFSVHHITQLGVVGGCFITLALLVCVALMRIENASKPLSI